MSGWFQLGPDEIAQRVRAGAGGAAVPLPSVSESIARGIAGYTLVSIAGCAPWAVAGVRLYRFRWSTSSFGAFVLASVSARPWDLRFMFVSAPRANG